MVTTLLENGAPPNGLDPIGSSPLAIAVALEFEDMVRLLLQRSACPNTLDTLLRQNPLEYAAAGDNHAIYNNLLKC